MDLRDRMQRVAHAADQALRDLGESVGSPGEIPEAIRFALAGRAGPAGLHALWCKQMIANGWGSGPYNANAKTHPHIVPWGELPIDGVQRCSLIYHIVEALRRDHDLVPLKGACGPTRTIGGL